MTINPKSVFKTFLVILGAILIGAIGSGVWENLLSPLFDSIIKYTIRIMTLGRTSGSAKQVMVCYHIDLPMIVNINGELQYAQMSDMQ